MPSLFNRSVRTLLRTICYGVAITIFTLGAAGEPAPNRYAIILEDPPVSDRFGNRNAVQSSEAQNCRLQVERQQSSFRNILQTRNLKITGSVSVVQNAIFVVATPEEAESLKSLSGVKGVVQLKTHQLKMNLAPQLVNAPAAWTELGGIPNAGAGMKIGVIDTGVDQNNPAFLDPMLEMPAGYPRCHEKDCTFTNNKVIVARSYVHVMAAGKGSDPAATSRPDDLSPRDRVGHGTAVAASAAANSTVTPAGFTMSGIAPKAWIGNYKVYGSPGVNDGSSDDAVIQALEDAFMDGMDVINYSSGASALTGPLDTGAACGNPEGVPCDLAASVFERLARQGVVLIVAAGNEGDDGYRYPSFNTIGSPANAPSVLAVGATTNGHRFSSIVRVEGEAVPPGIQKIGMLTTDAMSLSGGIKAPVRDVTSVGNDGYACSPLPPQSLSGTFALVQRGPVADPCFFATKMINVLNAGAVGMIVYLNDATSGGVFTGFADFSAPVAVIPMAQGLELKQFIANHPNYPVTIDGAGVEMNSPANLSSSFSSKGPATGTAILKPEVVAPGQGIYVSTQAVDSLGGMFSSTGFTVTQGTSFAAPITAGAAALVKQKNPLFTAEQVKSALVNTASADVGADGRGYIVDARSVGAGKVNAAAALNPRLTIVPSTISFGILNSNPLPRKQELKITNTTGSVMNVSLTVNETWSSTSATVTLDRTNFSIDAGATTIVNATLSGVNPAPGSYSGYISVNSQDGALRIPYLFLLGSGVPHSLIPLTGTMFEGVAGSDVAQGFFAFKVVDIYGVPVSGAPISWNAATGGKLEEASSFTNQYGVAMAKAVLGATPGEYFYTAQTPVVRMLFLGVASTAPAIQPTGVLNGASFDQLNPIAPGSYISIFGSNLSPTTGFLKSISLPMAMENIRVSFDVPGKNLSYPGRMVYVSQDQINVQVPWELQGEKEVKVKVLSGSLYGNVVTVPFADYSPAFFETSASNAAALDINNQVISSQHPVKSGQVVQLYVNGLGPVSNQPETGEGAPSSPLAETRSVPQVLVGELPAEVLFSGLAPGFAGLYQVNIRIPEGVPSGVQPLKISIGGYTSKTSGIPVQ